VLTLIAQTRGLDVRADFKAVLCEAALMAGLPQVIEAIQGRAEYVPVPAIARPEPEPDRDYPDATEVSDLWDTSKPVSADPESSAHFAARGLTAGVDDLVRAIQGKQPMWARYRGVLWLLQGYRAIVRAWDATGELRSVRAWRVNDSDGPKRLPPSCCRASGLVLANEPALQMLRTRALPARPVIVAEGEPDWVTLSVCYPMSPVLGVYSGSWTSELAARIPLGSDLVVRTHKDDAGDRYAAEIMASVKGRAVAWRI
jgi:hypothetical protein